MLVHHVHVHHVHVHHVHVHLVHVHHVHVHHVHYTPHNASKSQFIFQKMWNAGDVTEVTSRREVSLRYQKLCQDILA